MSYDKQFLNYEINHYKQRFVVQFMLHTDENNGFVYSSQFKHTNICELSKWTVAQLNTFANEDLIQTNKINC